MIISSHTASMARIKGKDGVLSLEIEVVGVWRRVGSSPGELCWDMDGVREKVAAIWGINGGPIKWLFKGT